MSVNTPRIPSSSELTAVGVLDSVQHLPAVTAGDASIADTRSFVDSSKKETTSHGSSVFNIVSCFCPEADFYLYQAVKDNRKIPLTAYQEAIDAAIEDGIDILNVSAGHSWPGPIDSCPYTPDAKRAIANDVTVVAAAGNRKPADDFEPVNCPAAIEDVIAVGGLVTECPADIECGVTADIDEKDPKGPYFARKQTGVEYPEMAPDGIYCGQQGCIEGNCIIKQMEKPWQYNADSTGDKPDVLAPFHFPATTNTGEPYLQIGTSFAAPVVSGTLAWMFSELKDSGKPLPRPRKTRQALLRAAVDVDEGEVSKLNVTRTLNELNEMVSP